MVAGSIEKARWAPETRSAKTGKESKIESWWEVKRAGPAEPAPTRGATPLVERFILAQSSTEEFALRTLRGYRQFMELKSVMNDWQELKLAPSVPINQMWELHLLDNLNYTEDCLLLFGRVIGHNPDAILDSAALRERVITTQIAFQARYGDDLDQDVWDFGDDWSRDTMSSPNPIKKFESLHVSSHGRLPVGRVDSDEGGRLPVSNLADTDESREPALAKTPSLASPGGGNAPITVFLRDQKSGEETYFSLRYKSTLKILFAVFAERRGLNQESIRFSYRGQQLTGSETPYSLALEDRARIDVRID